MGSRVVFGALLGLSIACALAPAAAAQPIRETGTSCVTFDGDAGSGDWGAPDNWSTDALPSADDDVCIPAGFPIVSLGTATPAIRSLTAPSTSLAIGRDLTVGSGGAVVAGLDIAGGTVVFDGPLTATSANLRGGTLGGAGDMAIRFLDWSGGALAGRATTTVGDGLRLRGTTAKRLTDRSLRLNGPSEVSAGLQIDGAGTLLNATTLTLNGDIALSGAGAGVRNAPGAVIRKAGGAGTATIAVPLDNDGALQVDSGEVDLAGGSPPGEASSGTYAAAGGAAIDWAAGAYALASPVASGTTAVSGATVSVTGPATLADVSVTAGALLADGALTARRVSLAGGVLGGAGALSLADLTWSGGALRATTITAGALSVTGGAAKSLVDGTLAVTGAATLAGALAFQGAARLENAGVLDIGDDVTLAASGGATPLLANRPGGVVRKSVGAGGATIGVPLDNDGLVDARAGTLLLTGGSGVGEVSSGAYAVGDGARIEWGAGAFALDAPSVTGAGTAAVSGAIVSASGPAAVANLALTGGGASFGGALSAGAVTLSGGTLTGGDMEIGRLEWTGGTLSGAGTATVRGMTLGGGATKSLSARILALAGDSVAEGAGPLQLSGAARLRNAALLDLRDDAAIRAGAGDPRLVNEPRGTVRKSLGAGTATLALPVDNQGTIEARSGRLQLTSLTGYDAGELEGGTYDATATLSVAGLDVIRNAATIRLHHAGRLTGGASDALAHLVANDGTLELFDGAALALPGDFTNSGTVRLAGARLTTAGDYIQTGTGVLRQAIAPGAAAGLAAAGAATLDGTLAIDRGDLEPADGATFPLLTYGSVAGRWSALTVPELAGTLFDVDYRPDGAWLTARRGPVPVPTTVPTAVPTAVPPPDGDGDGVLDARDDCPGVANAGQADRDRDGLGDECDTLPPGDLPVVPGERTGATVTSGEVLVQLPHATGFVPFQGAAALPTGTIVDARRGRLTITTASSFTNPGSPPTTIIVEAAIFRLRQVRARDQRTAVTDLLVRTPPGAARSCVTKKPRARPRARTIRRIVASIKGLARTFGGAAVLTTRNASFSMRDRCDGTATRVRKGRAAVFDRVRGRIARLRARQAHLVHARLFAQRRIRLRRAPRP